ncbi:MAG TPA: tail fiber domain-containing protein, partial [Casimicrobiaceae bacterium]|nr:tail fiber domain-containing protein [Casimicrobiaceae bacterium]
NYLYAVSLFTNPAVCVYDVSDPAAGPSLVGYTPSPFGSTVVTDGLASIALSGRYLYTLASYQNYVLVYDVTGVDLPNARIGDLWSTNLHISGNADFYNNLYVQGGLNVGLGGILSNGPLAASSLFANTTLGVGTSSPWGKFAISLNSGETNTNAFIIASSTASATTTLLVVTNAGNVGIGTTSPDSFKLQVKGDIGPDANNTYVLGSASLAWGCLYYNASVLGTCPSDQRLKDNVADLSFGSDPLARIAGLRLRTFNYKSAPGSTYSGLVAQEVEAVAPELVVTDASTTMKAVKYGDIQWLILAALQKLMAKVSDLTDTVASFAGHFATRELTFTRATGDEIDVNTVKSKALCLGLTCVSESELQALLRQTGQSPAAALANPAPQSPPTTGDQPADATVTGSSAPPVIDSPPLIPEEPEPTPATSTEPAAADEASTPAQSTSL